jgi:hypothetical protein
MSGKATCPQAVPRESYRTRNKNKQTNNIIAVPERKPMSGVLLVYRVRVETGARPRVTHRGHRAVLTLCGGLWHANVMIVWLNTTTACKWAEVCVDCCALGCLAPHNRGPSRVRQRNERM